MMHLTAGIPFRETITMPIFYCIIDNYCEERAPCAIGASFRGQGDLAKGVVNYGNTEGEVEGRHERNDVSGIVVHELMRE